MTVHTSSLSLSQSLLSTANLDLFCSFQTTLASAARHVCLSSEAAAVAASLKQRGQMGSAHVMPGGQCGAREKGNTLRSPLVSAHVHKDRGIFPRLYKWAI